MGKPTIVYEIKCFANGKSYIGITSNTIRRRWSGHVCAAMNKSSAAAIAKAIRHYGPQAFAITPIFVASDRKQACDVEIQTIRERNTRIPYGYNITEGGDNAATRRGHTVTEETRRKMSEAAKGKKKSPEHIAKMSANMKGKKRPHQSEVSRQIGYRNKGKKRTEIDTLRGRLRRLLEARQGVNSNANGHVGIERQCTGHWRARMTKANAKIGLGTYHTKEEAIAAYMAATAAYEKELRDKIAQLETGTGQ